MSNYTAILNGKHRSGTASPPSREPLILLGKEIDVVSQPPDNNSSDVDYQALVQELDEKGIQALLGMMQLSQDQGEFTLKDLRQKTGLSYTEAKNRVKPFEKKGTVVVNSRLNSRYPNMQATHFYSFADWVDVEQFRLILAGNGPGNKQDDERVDQKGQFSTTHTVLQSNKVPNTLEELRSVLLAINPPYRAAHIQILKWIAESGDTTAKEVSKRTGKRPSTSNAQLERVRGLGLSCREKRSGEYHYFLCPGLDKGLVEKLFYEDAHQDSPVISTQLKDTEPKTIQLVADMPLSENSSNAQHLTEQAKSLTPAEQLMEIMEKLPTFNQNWPEQFQEKWLNSFDRVTRFLVGETDTDNIER
ncbi:helix-turn-helix transcriptional regulator [Oculatella sp. LEGE 06141]|uniref:helix-turn-helix transcriptional regulator n=1 Tax=Oculatella sp. LEGE 06141 TaxID=1828648 RepID=UPI00187F223D|nr:helix-turn-helix transcriptional regulator [Oculatella sp. LEGE 06141]MBE9178719.1 helix-turn-helix transcriptional regulator [Oculatella sp. LEGE 06141]